MATTVDRTQLPPSSATYGPPAPTEPMTPPAPRPSRLRMAAGVLALFVVLGVAMEATARIEDLVRYGTPLFSPYRSQEDLTIRDADGVHGRPRARYQKWVMNGLGMRGPETSAEKPAGTFRIVTAGASETFGLYESPDKEYPRQLEDSLTAALRGGRCRCAGVERMEVMNAALAGMTLPTVAQDVQTRIRRLAPDVVLFYPTPSVYLWNEPPLAAQRDSNYRDKGHTLAARLHPRMIWRLRSQAKVVLPGFVQTWMRQREIAREQAALDSAWLFREVPAERLALFERDLRRFVGTVRAIGATPVLATHGNMFTPGQPMDQEELYKWAKFYPRAVGTTIVAFDSASRIATLRVAADSGVALVDVQPHLHREAKRAFADFSHFNDVGAGIVAGLMSETLLGVAANPATAGRRE